MTRALLVDDERLARRRMRDLLAAHPAVQVVAEAGSVAEAQTMLGRHAPIDLVFLDVQMPGQDGFALLEAGFSGAVVFVSAHPGFALRAFDVQALDYLLKPVSPDRLARSLARVLGAAPRSFLVRERPERTHVVRGEEVVRVAGAGDYAELHLADGRTLLSDERLRTWEHRLAPWCVRIHRGHLVAVEAVRGLERTERRGHVLVLRDGTQLPVARARLDGVRERLLGTP